MSATFQPLPISGPLDLIGMPYRLGAQPEKHGAGDCLSLTRTVLTFYGVAFPYSQRAWYRRLRRKDWKVFYDELECWGNVVSEAVVGTVALCNAAEGFGLAVYLQEQPGWLMYVDQTVAWCPLGAPSIERLYCQLRSKSAKP